MDWILKELVDFFRKTLPNYVLDILALLSAPKSFISKEARVQCDVRKALTFLVLSLILINCLMIPSIPTDHLTVVNGLAMVSYSVVFLTLHLFVIILSWRVVGSSPPNTRIVVVYSYVASIGFFLQCLLGWSYLFVFRVYPSLNQFSAEIQTASEDRILEILASHPELIEATFWIFGLFGLYFLLDLFWWLLTWGAFRQIAGVGWWRSSTAFMVSFLLGWALFAFSILFISVLVPDLLASAPK